MNGKRTRSRTADEALERLLAGNQRFVSGRPAHPNQMPACRGELTAGQQPLAAILGCADSRVPPEIIFDQGLGDLFTIRVAGNIADQATIGSLEYAVQHLSVPLVLVLGHSRCGAVLAAMSSGEAQGQIATLLATIQSAVKLAQADPGEPLDVTIARWVRLNVARVVSQLREAAPILAPHVAEGRVKILGAHYDLASGVVELLE